MNTSRPIPAKNHHQAGGAEGERTDAATPLVLHRKLNLLKSTHKLLRTLREYSDFLDEPKRGRGTS